MSEGFLPEIVVCPITPGMTGPPNLQRRAFNIGDKIEENIQIPDCGLAIEIGHARTIIIKEKISEIKCQITKTGELTRNVHVTIRFTEDKTDSYTMSVNL